eukprot:CAMPEP_0170302234 /NCGR_PEP_ID=MMETSP0116_2-20130129/51397_1 /TAXON_ID=400756 /ORGANISM="Durinskia baltica, Strain CSIRO CS-38" /LENGTH=72 /DNA_ID=CAMNT_0010554097 /DNA_START=122 /DNA_END=337 /DNA_ORIENTATION=+
MTTTADCGSPESSHGAGSSEQDPSSPQHAEAHASSATSTPELLRQRSLPSGTPARRRTDLRRRVPVVGDAEA